MVEGCYAARLWRPRSRPASLIRIRPQEIKSLPLVFIASSGLDFKKTPPAVTGRGAKFVRCTIAGGIAGASPLHRPEASTIRPSSAAGTCHCGPALLIGPSLFTVGSGLRGLAVPHGVARRGRDHSWASKIADAGRRSSRVKRPARPRWNPPKMTAGLRFRNVPAVAGIASWVVALRRHTVGAGLRGRRSFRTTKIGGRCAFGTPFAGRTLGSSCYPAAAACAAPSLPPNYAARSRS